MSSYLPCHKLASSWRLSHHNINGLMLGEMLRTYRLSNKNLTIALLGISELIGELSSGHRLYTICTDKTMRKVLTAVTACTFLYKINTLLWYMQYCYHNIYNNIILIAFLYIIKIAKIVIIVLCITNSQSCACLYLK